MTALAAIGHNAPPNIAIAAATDTATDLTAWIKENPSVENFEQMTAGDTLEERTVLALQGMEDERKPRVAPLNAQLKAINEPYRLVREPLERLLTEIRRRLSIFKNKVEAERKAEAERLRLEAEEKERLARDAETKEQEAIANAQVGECTDVGAATFEADQSFRDFQIADRTAARAERFIPVRTASIVGGRARVMRNVEEFTIIDACAALKALGVDDETKKLFVKRAKLYREEFGELPPGIESTKVRRM